jgi:uncharacterized membrane protein YdjX (TVP38/TMEM64 family)
VSSSPPEARVHLHHHPRGSLQRAAIRFGLLVALLVAGFALVRWTPLGDYLTAERLQELLGRVRGAWWTPLALVGLTTVLGAVGVPATPFLIAGAAIFGPLWGTLWSWLGILLASAAGYLLARALGREFVERIGGDKVRRAEKILHRRGFLPLVAARFVPIPFSLVNAAAAVVGVRLPKFLVATAIGLLPPVAIITYFTSALLHAASGDRAAIARQLTLVMLGAAFLVFLPIGIRRRLRRRRLRRLRARRAARAPRAPSPR